MQVNFAETGNKFYKLATAIPRLIGTMKNERWKALKNVSCQFCQCSFCLKAETAISVLLRYFLFCLFLVKLLSLTFRNDGVGWNSKNQNKVTKNKPALGYHLSECIFDLKTYPYRNSPYTRQFFDNWPHYILLAYFDWPPTTSGKAWTFSKPPPHS